MVKAFVFGKFLPFHKGHEAMIRFALNKCDFLTVLICCSDRENVPAAVRAKWLGDTFAGEKKIEIETFFYKESELPNTSVSSREVSAVWADVFKKRFPDYSLLITSEDYGAFVAGYMHIRHIGFDVPRKLHPVSATRIRDHLFDNWNYLPGSVKPYYAVKVVILGTESTGKTTLTEKLSAHFHCGKVLEAGRDLIPDSHTFTMDDLRLVAREHALRIDRAAAESNSPLLIIDTDIHITKSYGRFAFRQELEVESDIIRSNKAGLYLYLNNDVEYVQDGTRLTEKERNLLDLSHRQVLKENRIDYVEISGGWDDRLKKAIREIKQFVASLSCTP